MDYEKTPTCDCELCLLHTVRYNLILVSNPMWLTISPPPSDITPKKIINQYWLYIFGEIALACENMLCAIEFENLRMHFHILIAVKDKIKLYKVYNKLREQFICRIYRGGPDKGLHYLFKNISEAYELLDGQAPVVVFEDLKEYKAAIKHKYYLKSKPTNILEYKI